LVPLLILPLARYLILRISLFSNSPLFFSPPTHRAHLVRGSYPSFLLPSWLSYANRNPTLALNPSPFTSFSSSQLYLILHLPFGGTDLEEIKIENWKEAAAVFWQVVQSLTEAENMEFEHRDLHWGNLLVRKVGKNGKEGEKEKEREREKRFFISPKKKIGSSFKNSWGLNSPIKKPVGNSKLDGGSKLKNSWKIPIDDGDEEEDSFKDKENFRSSKSVNPQLQPLSIKALLSSNLSGIEISMIDFSLSRIRLGKKVLFNPFEDECLFEGEGDSQFQVYRDMRTLIGESWDGFWPLTNVMVSYLKEGNGRGRGRLKRRD